MGILWQVLIVWQAERICAAEVYAVGAGAQPIYATFASRYHRLMATDNFWFINECRPWHDATESYPAVIAGFDDPKLVSIDNWFRLEFPAAIQSRTPPAITGEELVRLTEWKMRRGVWRARNLMLVKSNGADEVLTASREAFAAAPDPLRPVRRLSELAGVGPATASAGLAAAFPDLYPFMDDVVAAQMPGMESLKFTVREYKVYAEALIARAAELSDVCTHQRWTAQDVGNALFANGGGTKRPNE